jgi:hypothetical protein
MKFVAAFPRFFTVIIAVLLLSSATSFAADIKPYKIALIIGDQWDDPAGFIVNHTRYTGSHDFASEQVPSGRDFSSLVIMLKSWCVPFTIIRLDQEFMDINRFVGPDGKPDVGCIVWDADQTANLLPQQYKVLEDAVNNYGISLIALGDRIKEPAVQNLLGVKYVGAWSHSDDLTHSSDHFIMHGLPSPLDQIDGPAFQKKRVQVTLTDAKAIVSQGKYPQVTVKNLSSGARAVWIGGDIDRMFAYEAYRTLLRGAITWSIGYSLFKTWENKAWLIMDDPGGAQNAWLEHWRYPTLTEEQIDQRLIKPLKEHNAILIVNVCPGFVNDELQRVEPAFQRKFTDQFGVQQDYPSTLRGLKNGLKAGVFEIQCHGLTHMQPDLFSPPGPWYGAELDQERAEVGWYREFGDTRRNKEIPAAEALWRMKTADKWLENIFAVTALSIRPGGGGVSTSYPNNTVRLSALAGFGWGGGRTGYLGQDIAISGWDFEGTSESPLSVSAPPDGHDKGIAQHPEQFLKVFADYPDVQWMGLNEYVGYTHAKVFSAAEDSLTLHISYDLHYCMYFKDRPSQWYLLLSDWLAEKFKTASIAVDDRILIKNADFSELLTIEVPAGTGTHSINIRQK